MKSKVRVKGYKEGTQDWNAEYNMLLDDGITCSDCVNCIKCVGIFGSKPTDDKCQFYPTRFRRDG